MIGALMSADFRSVPRRAADCLKVCYKLRERGERISTSAMRDRLQALEPSGQLSDASVTQLFKWLASEGYVRHTPYHGVELTPRGDELATLFVRRHRLLELFLVKIMGFTLDAVDAEAEQLEHVISDAFVDRMDILLGHPTEDPHGDPIPHPLPNGVPTTPFPPVQRLSDLAPGDNAVIRWVNDDNAEALRYLETLGLVPGARVSVRERAPFDGPLHVRVGAADDDGERLIGPQLAAEIGVATLDKTDDLE
jgi:DtxR family Mn-dependent transcriptional regulator